MYGQHFLLRKPFFFIAESVCTDNKPAEMLDTVSVETNTAEGDTGHWEAVGSCRGNKEEMVRTGEEEDSGDIDGLVEKMHKSCHVSSDCQNGVDSNAQCVSTVHKDVEGDQNEVSDGHGTITCVENEVLDLDEEIGSVENEVLDLDEEIGSVESEVLDVHDEITGVENEVLDVHDEITGVENEVLDVHGKITGAEEIGSDQNDGLPETIARDQKQESAGDNETNNQGQTKVGEGQAKVAAEGDTDEDRNPGTQDEAERKTEPSAARKHREGVEHECPSPTDIESDEPSYDDDDEAVVKVVLRETSISDEEELNKVTEALR